MYMFTRYRRNKDIQFNRNRYSLVSISSVNKSAFQDMHEAHEVLFYSSMKDNHALCV